MKKVISALTAAAMCASMTAGIMTASAVYTSGDMAYDLRVVDTGKGTVSADGKTITFASGEATGDITLQQFFVADASDPSVQQLTAYYTTDSAKIKLNAGKDSFDEYYSEEKSYTDKNGTTFSTTSFVNTFGYLNFIDEFESLTGAMTWGDTFGEGFILNGDNSTLSFNWMYSFGDDSRANGTDTAAFLGEKSDSFPVNEFTATLDNLADGTYEIYFLDTMYNPDRGNLDCNWVQVDSKNKVTVGSTSGITIVVGDGEPSTSEPTEAPPQPTEEPTQTPTDPDDGRDYNYDKFTWYIKDAYFNPETDKSVTIEVCVANDQGAYTVGGTFTMDGGTPLESGWQIGSMAMAGSYKAMNVFVGDKPTGAFGGAVQSTELLENIVADNHETVIEIKIAPQAGTVLKDKYALSIYDLGLANADSTDIDPSLYDFVGGTLYVVGGEKTDPTDPATEPPTADQPTEPPTSDPNPGNYLYGDVNKNGKVELVDVVMLNRFITQYADQDLDDYQVVVANCYRANNESDEASAKTDLDGKDSVEILKYLIEKITSLPTNAG